MHPSRPFLGIYTVSISQQPAGTPTLARIGSPHPKPARPLDINTAINKRPVSPTEPECRVSPSWPTTTFPDVPTQKIRHLAPRGRGGDCRAARTAVCRVYVTYKDVADGSSAQACAAEQGGHLVRTWLVQDVERRQACSGRRHGGRVSTLAPCGVRVPCLVRRPMSSLDPP